MSTHNPHPSLFQPISLGSIDLKHRVVLAPLTRNRATTPGNIPNDLNVEYYHQRASDGGLLITEATQVTPFGQGYPSTPGIHSQEQVEGWKKVTEAVHEKGGKIVLQLWHVGRISHSSILPDGVLPVSASAVTPAGGTVTAQWQGVPFETPRALTLEEIPIVVSQYKEGAANAKAAGFDGVEIHGANGYLVDQFLQDSTNQRTDAYGGSIENRVRFMLEVVDAVVSVWGSDKVGIRLSPYGKFNDMKDSNAVALFEHAIQELSKRNLAYLHLVEARGAEGDMQDLGGRSVEEVGQIYRSTFGGKMIGAGGFNGDTAEEAVASGSTDLIAFGRWFIANPDLPKRLQIGAELNPYDRDTFYGGTAKGYTDYPFLSDLS